ncbi:MAG: hypothetical protein JWN14_3216 [Chthonomonadales bacterium]|nr:hypothetical protein [Chthonomonadales bacterium]
MRNKIWRRGVVGLVAGAAFFFVAATIQSHPQQSMQTAEPGGMKKMEIVSRSQPLLQSLLASSMSIETVACPMTTFTAAGQTIHHWNIDCTDPITGDTAHLLWNADNGELVRASHFRLRGANCEFDAPSRQKEAVGLAWDWFHVMKIDRPSEEWRIVDARKKPYAEWDICLRSGDRYSILTVKTDSGQLVQAICGHLPSSDMVWAPFKKGVAS